MASTESPASHKLQHEVGMQTESQSQTNSVCLVKPGKRFQPTVATAKLCLLKPAQPEGDWAVSFEAVPGSLVRHQLLPVTPESLKRPIAQKQVHLHEICSASSTVPATPMNWVDASLKQPESSFRKEEPQLDLEVLLERLVEAERSALENEFRRHLHKKSSLNISGIHSCSGTDSDHSVFLDF